jgi:hypothetical protein
MSVIVVRKSEPIVSVHSIVAQMLLDGRKLEANQFRFQHFIF